MMDTQSLFDEHLTGHLQFGFHGAQPSCGYSDCDSGTSGEGLSLSQSHETNELSGLDLERPVKLELPNGQPRAVKQLQERAAMAGNAPRLDIGSHNATQTVLKAPWQASNPSPDSDRGFSIAPSPPSAQTKIANQRESAGQRFGQVTPPDEVAKLSVGVPPKRTKSSSDEADAQRLRQERARNAAHTRHARNSSNRKARKDSRADENAGDDEQHEGPVDGKREKYREKNRLAAAKCRSKKKASVGDLEERHRVMAAENSFRRLQERQLRDQLTYLRTMALEHGPDRCRCGDVHRYNQNKAAEMAFGHRSSGEPIKNMGSPSQESTVLSPFSDFAPTFDDQCAAMHDGLDLGMMDPSTEPPSSATEASMRTAPYGTITNDPTDDDPMLSLNSAHDDFPMFSNFLQSSPGGGGRPAFA